MQTKDDLTRMFLITLDKYLDPANGKSPSNKGIVESWINEDYNVNLSPEEIGLLYNIIEDLKSNKIICPKKPGDLQFYEISEKGKKLLEDLKSSNLNENWNEPDWQNLINDKELLNQCKTDLAEGTLGANWRAIRNATVYYEDFVRKKAGLSNDDHGVNLMTKVFSESTGVLKIPCCGTNIEEMGFHQINRGIIQFHRNAKGHRVELLDRKCAIKILLYLDYLITIVKTTIKREN